MERNSTVGSVDDVEVFLHQPGTQPVGVSAGLSDTLQAILDRAGLSGANLEVFVGEPADDFHDDPATDEEDAQEPAPLSTTLASAGGRRHCHVCVCHCRRVAVEVHYQNRELRRRFSPASTVARVIRWARRRLQLTDADADRLVLQVCGTTDQPRPQQQLGELVKRPSCEICFDLVHDVRVEG